MPLPLVAVFEHVIARCNQEGIPVVEWSGPHPVTGNPVKWRDMTMPYSFTAEPTGLLDHHTAPPVPYPINKLADRCNYTIRHPDGAVVLMNAGIAYDSGNGDRNVLAAVREDRPAPAPTDTYNLAGLPAGTNPGVSGTRWYVDVEVQHLGDGSPLLPALRRSLIVANAALCEALSFDPRYRVIGHREWTKRKIDPRWDGFANPMPSIRADVAAQIAAWNQGDGDDDMNTPDFVKRLTVSDIDALVDAGVINPGNADKAAEKKFWGDKLANPNDPAWVGFHQEVEAQALVNAAVGRGGGGPLKVALAGTATPT